MMTSSNGTFSALLALCAGNSPVTGEFPTQRPVTRSFNVFFDIRLNKRLSKQSWGWWFETPSSPLWRHRNDIYSLYLDSQKTPHSSPSQGVCVNNHREISTMIRMTTRYQESNIKEWEQDIDNVLYLLFTSVFHVSQLHWWHNDVAIWTSNAYRAGKTGCTLRPGNTSRTGPTGSWAWRAIAARRASRSWTSRKTSGSLEIDKPRIMFIFVRQAASQNTAKN